MLNGLSTKELCSRFSLIKRFLLEKEQGKLERKDPEIVKKKKEKLLPSVDLKTIVSNNIDY